MCCGAWCGGPGPGRARHPRGKTNCRHGAPLGPRKSCPPPVPVVRVLSLLGCTERFFVGNCREYSETNGLRYLKTINENATNCRAPPRRGGLSSDPRRDPAGVGLAPTSDEYSAIRWSLNGGMGVSV